LEGRWTPCCHLARPRTPAFKKTPLNTAPKALDFLRGFFYDGHIKKTFFILKAMTRSHPPRTAIYARVSTLDQDPAMQLRELTAYARHRGLPIRETFIDQVSGATRERPALDRLWQAVRAREVDTVLVWKFDRFARSTKQLIDALEEFRHLGVAFISITGSEYDWNRKLGCASCDLRLKPSGRHTSIPA
jgi:Resolvase, N terminal domain